MTSDPTMVNAVNCLVFDIEDDRDGPLEPTPIEDLAAAVAAEYSITAADLMDAYREYTGPGNAD